MICDLKTVLHIPHSPNLPLRPAQYRTTLQGDPKDDDGFRLFCQDILPPLDSCYFHQRK